MKIRSETLSTVTGISPLILSAISTEQTISIILLILGIISSAISITNTLYNLTQKIKDKKIRDEDFLEAINEIEGEIDKWKQQK